MFPVETEGSKINCLRRHSQRARVTPLDEHADHFESYIPPQDVCCARVVSARMEPDTCVREDLQGKSRWYLGPNLIQVVTTNVVSMLMLRLERRRAIDYPDKASLSPSLCPSLSRPSSPESPQESVCPLAEPHFLSPCRLRASSYPLPAGIRR